jgi:hypothetical protein
VNHRCSPCTKTPGKVLREAGCQRLTPITLATREAEIRRIVVQSQPGPYLEKNPSPKRAGGMAQGIGPEFKPQYHRKKNKNKNQDSSLEPPA